MCSSSCIIDALCSDLQSWRCLKMCVRYRPEWESTSTFSEISIQRASLHVSMVARLPEHNDVLEGARFKWWPSKLNVPCGIVTTPRDSAIYHWARMYWGDVTQRTTRNTGSRKWGVHKGIFKIRTENIHVCTLCIFPLTLPTLCRLATVSMMWYRLTFNSLIVRYVQNNFTRIKLILLLLLLLILLLLLLLIIIIIIIIIFMLK
jgi:hypothetical protein